MTFVLLHLGTDLNFGLIKTLPVLVILIMEMKIRTILFKVVIIQCTNIL